MAVEGFRLRSGGAGHEDRGSVGRRGRQADPDTAAPTARSVDGGGAGGGRAERVLGRMGAAAAAFNAFAAPKPRTGSGARRHVHREHRRPGPLRRSRTGRSPAVRAGQVPQA
ncbi:hypothetical protein ACFPC0_28395 [Streptomyces andamanensis]|uniref:Uncharacterized protein n=1 Tax=Streptomyces andamanensis TaxID=1565035 RepID=A0ABV8TM65_9ACTN